MRNPDPAHAAASGDGSGDDPDTAGAAGLAGAAGAVRAVRAVGAAGVAGVGETPGDAEIVALLVGELRAATAAARARGASAEQVLALVEDRRRALRRCRVAGAPDPDPAGSAADASAPGVDGR